jgi:hypothetical protein
MKVKGCRFETIEAIKTDSQAVLNTLTESDFQNTFEKWQKC